MTRLSTAQVYALTQQAGFGKASGVIMTAIVAAESGNRTDAIGDRNLTEPGEKSVGLAQINYRPSRDVGVRYRDPVANLDPLTNLKNAYLISGQGRKFTPWSTFTNGAYAKGIAEARVVAGQPLVPVPKVVASDPAPNGADAQNVGLTDLLKGGVSPLGAWLWDKTTDGASGAQKSIVEAVTKGAITLTVIAGGMALVVLGARETVAPVVQKQREKAMQLAPLAAAL